MKRSYVICAALGMALLLASCGGSGTGAQPSSSSPTPIARPSSTATMAIVSPKPGDVVSTSGVLVKVSLEGATLSKQASTNLRPDQGHIHLLVDAKTITLLGSLEVETGPLSPGPHLIQVEFAANDHGPFNPRVLAQVTIRAE